MTTGSMDGWRCFQSYARTPFHFSDSATSRVGRGSRGLCGQAAHLLPCRCRTGAQLHGVGPALGGDPTQAARLRLCRGMPRERRCRAYTGGRHPLHEALGAQRFLLGVSCRLVGVPDPKVGALELGCQLRDPGGDRLVLLPRLIDPGATVQRGHRAIAPGAPGPLRFPRGVEIGRGSQRARALRDELPLGQQAPELLSGGEQSACSPLVRISESVAAVPSARTGADAASAARGAPTVSRPIEFYRSRSQSHSSSVAGSDERWALPEEVRPRSWELLRKWASFCDWTSMVEPYRTAS